MSSVIDNFTAYLPSIDRGSVKHLWTFNTSGSHKLLSNLTPLHFCLNHPRTRHGLSLITSPSKMTTAEIHRLTAVVIWQLWCHAAQKYNFDSLRTTYVLTEIQPAKCCVYRVLFGRTGNGGRAPYCGLTSALWILLRERLTSPVMANAVLTLKKTQVF